MNENRDDDYTYWSPMDGKAVEALRINGLTKDITIKKDSILYHTVIKLADERIPNNKSCIEKLAIKFTELGATSAIIDNEAWVDIMPLDSNGNVISSGNSTKWVFLDKKEFTFYRDTSNDIHGRQQSISFFIDIENPKILCAKYLMLTTESEIYEKFLVDNNIGIKEIDFSVDEINAIKDTSKTLTKLSKEK